jgi:hypothetical protein
MWNQLKASLLCLFLGLIFSGAAQAEKQHRQHGAQPRVQTFAANFSPDFSSGSFAEFLSPGVSLGDDFSPLFQKKNRANWTISSILLILPNSSHELGGVLAFGKDISLDGLGVNTFVTSTFIHYRHYFQPLVLLVFYEQQVAAVPEASAAVMMALGLPLLAWLAWRRQRLG